MHGFVRKLKYLPLAIIVYLFSPAGRQIAAIAIQEIFDRSEIKTQNSK